jgi:hypothetical protein
MMGITHAAAGALAGATVAHLTGGNLALCMGVGALAGLLPVCISRWYSNFHVPTGRPR